MQPLPHTGKTQPWASGQWETRELEGPQDILPKPEGPQDRE